MLLNSLYTLNEITELSKDEISAQMRLINDSTIFLGHFPENPILPGVSMVQATADLLSQHFKVAYTMRSADYIKFIALVDPSKITFLQLSLKLTSMEEEVFSVQAQLSGTTNIYVKLKGIFSTYSK